MSARFSAGAKIAKQIAIIGASVVFVESFRVGSTDSEAIQAALDYVGTNYVGKRARVMFEAGREYVYNATATLRYINDLDIDLNGATLKRAPASTTVTTLALDAGTGQATLYLTSIPANWKVGEHLVGFSGPADSQTSRNPTRITAINYGNNSVTMQNGLGVFGGFATIIPAGCSIGKSFSAFGGRPSSTESQYPLTEGVNANIHIKNGVINGNVANQVNSSWRYCSEIQLQGNGCSVSGMTFKDTTSECILGHGVRVEGNRFLNMGGSCLHTSVHDNTLEEHSSSWFINNFADGINLKTQAVIGHSEGAVTFSWGAGRLFVLNNDLRNGSEGVLGAFGPSSGETMADKWLTISGNTCINFASLFPSIVTPIEGMIITNNTLVNIALISEQTTKLLTSATSTVYGNIVLGGSPINGALRASQAVFGPMDAGTVTQVKMLARSAAVAGFDYGRLSANPAAVEGAAAMIAMVTSDAGIAGMTFFSPSGTTAGSFYQIWTPATKRLKFLANEAGAALEFAAPMHAPGTSLPTYATNADAVAGGKPVGQLYKTATGELRVVV